MKHLRMSSAVNPNWATYDLSNLVDNLSEVRRQLAPGRDVFAAIKGNAYGHGAFPVARTLERAGISAFMTGSYDEATELRELGIRAPIVMFAGALPDGIPDIINAGLIPTIVDMASARAAAQASMSGTPASIYVKVNMGLGRLGVAASEAETFIATLSEMPGLKVDGIYTHLPYGNEAGLEWARGRYVAFDDLIRRLDTAGLVPPVTQAGASSSVVSGIVDQANSVCVGHLLYGLSPYEPGFPADLANYKPVISEIGSRLVQVTAHRQGSDVVIAGMQGIRTGKRIGVAPIGAAHGLHRPAPGSAPVAVIRGMRVPILAVSLEHLTVDLDAVETAEVGDEVLLLGGDEDARISLDELAGWSGLSCLDTVLAVSGRLDAHYIGEA